MVLGTAAVFKISVREEPILDVQNLDNEESLEVDPPGPAKSRPGRVKGIDRRVSQPWGLEKLIERRALLLVASLLALIKSIQFAVDSQTLFFYDSGAFIQNALGTLFIPYRSYFYGDLIRAFALPFHSLRVIVVMQMVMGGCTAWLLTFALVRFWGVRPWIAILAAVAFAFDPVQIVHEHLVMTETSAMLAMAVYVVTALQYFRTRSPQWLVILAFLGIALVGFRTVYLPVVLTTAVLIPAIPWISFPGRRLGGLALALLVSCGATLLFHEGYRHLTGRLGRREPAYSYSTGSFVLASVSPIVEPGDSPDPRISQAIVAQSTSRYPLVRASRDDQMWADEGLVARIKKVFGGDERASDQAMRSLSLAAVRRNPLGYIALAVQGWLDYWRRIPVARYALEYENGMKPSHEVNAFDVAAIRSAFGVDVTDQDSWHTLSRRYHLFAANWHIFLLLSPFLCGLAFILNPQHRKETGFLFLWTVLLLVATCFAQTDSVLRYLHPFSFIALVATAILGEKLACRTQECKSVAVGMA